MDWWCSTCKFKIFGSKNVCRKCGSTRPGLAVAPVPAQVQHVLVERTVRVASGLVKPGDWECGACHVNNFASRAACFKCKRAKPVAPVAQDGTIAAGGDAVVTQATRECVVCADKQPEVVYLPCQHMSCCKACSDRLEACPICRAGITQRIVPFQV